jgi:uncharacterized membrane protein SpoIIM required for sporulation
LSDLYIELIDDLSYAQTHFRGSSLTQYLNQLAVAAHQQIYGTRRERKSRFFSFFRTEVPMAFASAKRFFFYALVIFLSAIGLGWISGTLDPEFLRLIVGDHYVNQTLENIKHGDPMAIYKGTESDAMFFMISTNNIRVAFITFIFGVLGGIPTVLLLLFNGVMVGAFVQFFFQQGLGGIALSTIFLHGAMELTAIVIAGGSGLMLGSAVLFPGTYSRAYYVVHRAREALKVIIGVTPFIIFAALIESYVTRLYLDMPPGVRIAIILVTFVLMMLYLFSKPKTTPHEQHRI